MDTAKGSDDPIRMKIRFEDLLLQAETRFIEKDYQTAQSLLDEAKELGSSEDPKVLFYEASILQAKGDIQRAAKYFNRAGLSPGLDTDLISYVPYLSLRQNILAEQFVCITSDIPSIVMTSFPRSASAFIINFSSAHLKVPVGRMSIGMFPDMEIVPIWAERLAQGGMINHEHFPPSSSNLAALKAARISKLAVHVRDPRQQLISWVHHRTNEIPRGVPQQATAKEISFVELSFEEKIDWMIETHFPKLIEWVVQWIDAAEREKDWLEIRFTTYEEFVADKTRFVEELWAFFGIGVDPGILESNINKVEKEAKMGAKWSNFRQGTVDEWRKVATVEQQKAMGKSTLPELAERFGWSL
jgi:hypothetical protein